MFNPLPLLDMVSITELSCHGMGW